MLEVKNLMFFIALIFLYIKILNLVFFYFLNLDKFLNFLLVLLLLLYIFLLSLVINIIQIYIINNLFVFIIEIDNTTILLKL